MDLNVLIAICIFCWGIWGIFDKLALETSSYQDVILMLYLLYLPVIPPVWIALNCMVPGWRLTGELMLWTGLAALGYTVAMVAYMHAMSKTEASYVLGITASYPVILQFLALAMLGEKLVPARLAGALFVGLGVFAIGVSPGRTHNTLGKRDRIIMIVCVCLATLCWGIWGIFDKRAVSIAHPLTVYFAQCLWDVALLAALWTLFASTGHKPALKSLVTWKYCALSGTMLLIGAFAYLTALSMSTASYVIVITGCYPLLMYLFALWFLKEKFNRARLAGIILVVVGGIIVQTTQSM